MVRDELKKQGEKRFKEDANVLFLFLRLCAVPGVVIGQCCYDWNHPHHYHQPRRNNLTLFVNLKQKKNNVEKTKLHCSDMNKYEQSFAKRGKPQKNEEAGKEGKRRTSLTECRFGVKVHQPLFVHQRVSSRPWQQDAHLFLSHCNRRPDTRKDSTLNLSPPGRSLVQLRVSRLVSVFLFYRAADSLVSLNYRY